MDIRVATINEVVEAEVEVEVEVIPRDHHLMVCREEEVVEVDRRLWIGLALLIQGVSYTKELVVKVKICANFHSERRTSTIEDSSHFPRSCVLG